MGKKIKSKADLQPDRGNANKSTIRGEAAVAESLSRYGAGRSILADKNGKIIAGNTTERNWEGEIIVIPTDGKALVVVQRTDLDLETDIAARELAHADNRTNQLGYDVDVSKLTADMTKGADLSWLWRADEMDALKGALPEQDEDGETPIIDFDKVPRNTGYELTVVFNSEDDLRDGRKAIQGLGYFTK